MNERTSDIRTNRQTDKQTGREHYSSASEATALRRYTNLIIIKRLTLR